MAPSTAHDERLARATNAGVIRRDILGYLASIGVASVLWPAIARAEAEIWEEGDSICAQQDTALEKPNGYELDDAYLASFLSLSEILTGVAPLDRHLGNEFLERYATNRQLTTNLDLMIQAYRNLPGQQRPNETDVHQKILMSQEKRIKAAAQQLIFIWYIGAFYIPDPKLVAPGVPAPLEADDARKKVWAYGTPRQYGRALLWSVIRAHAPMTSGGLPGHWSNPPKA